MRILILGAGEVGSYLARQLSEEGHDVVVVEQDPERARGIQDAMDALVVEGNGASLATLEKAGVGRTDLLLAVTSHDEINLMACLCAAQYQVRTKIARVSRTDYYDRTGILPLERLGVDLMINPERECAMETFQLLQRAAATEYAQFEGGLVDLIGLQVRPDAPIAGKTLAEIGALQRGSRYLIVAVVRGGRTVIPTGADRVETGDEIFVLGEPTQIPDVLPLAGHQGFNLSRVIIAGGSREALYLAKMLETAKIDCTILESHRPRAVALAAELNRSLVLHGDATDLELLEMEGVGDADGFVAYTGSDETNILACLLAKSLGTRKVISLIDRFRYVPLVAQVGVDASVSPRLSTVNAILGYVRRGSVLSVATLKGTAAEAIEFNVSPRFPHAGKSLQQVRFPTGALVGAIVRGNRVIIPRGTDQIRVGDRVIVFALPDAIPRVESLFA
ncbi:MAG: Trk system potassium transporter TrkA [Gemmatimonadota bacterium]|nr:Trk system potassium transporter TrkA [Gemmatimonadota bacterium]